MFTYRRRVHFAETDMAGLVHFSVFFRYMEEAEHALWRAAGLSIARAGDETGWPRLSAVFDFKAPLYFEDEFEVALQMAVSTGRTVQYSFTMTRDDTTIGTGTLTTAYVSKRAGEPMKIQELPREMVERLRAAAGGD